LQDGRFGKIEQEDLASTCKINQDLCLARLSKMILARYCKNKQDRGLARLSKIKQDWARFLGKIEQDLARFRKIEQD
jgi:hypothetical protein